jgi:hypothetical protein
LQESSKKFPIGAVMTEMVIVMPVILLLMAAIIQFAMLFCDSLQLNYASYRRTRGAIVKSGDDKPTFPDDGWKKVMPGAESIDELNSAVSLSGNDSEYIDTLLVTSTLKYDSQLLIPMIFDPNTLKDLDEEGRQCFQLRAKGFSPAVFLSPEEEGGGFWSWLPWVD